MIENYQKKILGNTNFRKVNNSVKVQIEKIKFFDELYRCILYFQLFKLQLDIH